MGVPARKWLTRAEVLLQLERGRSRLKEDPHSTVLEAALEGGMSTEHFIRMFSETYGIKPSKYLAKARLELARAELEKTGQPVWQIGLKFGFKDSSAFCRAFRREFGVSPQKARKEFSQFQHIGERE